MDSKEAFDITVAYLSLLFFVSRFSIERAETFALPLFTAFILHELGHRYVARQFGFEAKFQLWVNGLLFAALIWVISGFRFVFFAPGAVVVGQRTVSAYWVDYPTPNGVLRVPVFRSLPYPTREEMGKIALAGPLTNIAIAVIVLPIYLLFPIEPFLYTVAMNLFIALFNLIPIGPLDGKKIYTWNPTLWAVLFTPLITLFVIGLLVG